jgi:D-amino-acid oxidase
MHITVVGAGVVGLTCALHARRSGHSVEVVTAAPASETTSSIAAALWYPYRAFPRDAVARWAAAGFTALTELAGDPRTGVRSRTGVELFRAPAPDPWWRDAVPSVRRVPPAELPAGYADGLQLTVPVVDMAVHLAWLTTHLHELGVAVRRERVEDLDTVDGDVVVNCAGLGARELCADATMLPVRGQVVVVEQVGLRRWTLDQSDPQLPTYVVPRLETIVLGGTAEEGDEDLAVRPATAAQVLQRCAAVVPELAGARVLAHRVGLRPGRPAVRLETEQRARGPVVHCYGHGGAGVTLAHGCAQDVVHLLAQHA